MISYTTIPFVSAFFLVLVGVLIGHQLRNRFRGDPDPIATHLRQSSGEWRARFEQQLMRYRESQACLQTKKRELDVLHRKTDALEAELTALCNERDALRLQLERSERHKDNSIALLKDERDQRLKVKARLEVAMGELKKSTQLNRVL